MRQFVWFSHEWEKLGYPSHVSLSVASVAMGLHSNFLNALIRNQPDHHIVQSLEFEDNKVFVPSLIEQIKWIPIRDGFQYLDMHERALRYFVIYTDLYTEMRDFRGCRCIEIEEIMKIGIWKRVQGWTKRRLKVKLRDGLAALPVDALVSVMRIVGDVNKT